MQSTAGTMTDSSSSGREEGRLELGEFDHLDPYSVLVLGQL